MTISAPCQSPDAVYRIKIDDRSISLVVDLPDRLSLTEDEAILLESNIHNAVELVLARYFGA